MALIGFALVWTFGAFGEELVWRGYLMNRVADLGRHAKWAWACSLILVNIGFGFAHGYQGVTGVIDEGLMGVLLGILYLLTGCNLVVPIIAHGVQDTIDLLSDLFRKISRDVKLSTERENPSPQRCYTPLTRNNPAA